MQVILLEGEKMASLIIVVSFLILSVVYLYGYL